MKRPTLTDLSTSSKTDMDDQITEAVIDAIRSNEKTIEIRPATQSSGPGLLRLLLFVGIAIGISYWLRKSQNPTDAIQSVTSKTADRTKRVTERAAETIQGSGETVAQRVEEGSEMAGEKVEETGERTAAKAEQTGEKVVEKADESDSSSSS